MPLTAAFFASLRTPLALSSTAGRQPLFEHYSQRQVDSLNAIAAVFDAFTGHDHCPDDLAYIMATCYRECGAALDLTIEERGHGATKPYGLPAGPYHERYYGRGPPQVTWLKNYQKAKTRTGIDFVQFPQFMCEHAKGIVYMIDAMYAGLFTGHGLRTYIAIGKVTTFEAFRECRRIINGLDHADEVAYVALAFQAALRAGYVKPKSIAVQKPQQSAQSRGVWATILSLLGRK